MSAHIVIAGSGLAAQRCCDTLRRAGHRGRITLVCAEPVVGHASLGDTVELDGDLTERALAAVWRSRGRPVAALLVGRPRARPQMRRLVQEGLEHQPQEMTV